MIKRTQRIALAVIAISLLMSSAIAHPQAKTDRDDVGGRLDITATGSVHDAQELYFQIRTFEGWGKRLLERGNIYFYLDTRGDNTPEFNLIVFFDSLNGYVCELHHHDGGFIDMARASKPSRDKAACTVDRDLLGEIAEGFGWAAATQMKKAGGGYRYDFAPNGGLYWHPL